MPMLFSLELHAALMAVAARLREGERLLAFLDDLYIVTSPDRTVEVHNILREELWCHARISLHQGKTRIWNRGGIMPDRCNILEQAARAVDPTPKVWRGSHEGIIVLGTPVGHQEFVKQELLKTVAEHSKFLLKIPEVQDRAHGCCFCIVVLQGRIFSSELCALN